MNDYMNDYMNEIEKKYVGKNKNKIILKFKKFIKRIYYNNIIRQLFLGDKDKRLTILKGLYYQILHSSIVYSILIILCFVNNIYYLLILLIILSLDSFCIIVLHNCPLTMLEHKYLGTSLLEEKIKFMNTLGIQYEISHTYEKQLELVTNTVCILVFKILLLIIVRYFGYNI